MDFDKDTLYLGTFIASIGGAWFLIRYQVAELLKTQKSMFEKLDRIGDKTTRSEQDLHAIKKEVEDFAKYKQKITILEQTTARHIDFISAEEKFVTRKEFELVVKSMENDIKDIKGGQFEILKFLKKRFGGDDA